MGCIFNRLGWTGKGERPSAYIIITGDRNVSSNFYCDHGIAAQSILLGAIEKGLGGCIIANIDKQNLIKDLNIPQNLEILLVIALGTPEEKIKIEGIPENKKYKILEDCGQDTPRAKKIT